MDEPWKSAAILRRCQVCGEWRLLSNYPGKRIKTCGRCSSVHVRSYVLTEQGHSAISKRRVVA